MPDPGGVIDLDVYFEYSRADPPACFKRIQALAGSSDVLRAAHSLHYDASYPGEYRRLELRRSAVTVDPYENFGAAASRLMYGRRHPALEVVLPVPLGPPHKLQNDRVGPGGIGFLPELRIFDRQGKYRTAYVLGHQAVNASLTGA